MKVHPATHAFKTFVAKGCSKYRDQIQAAVSSTDRNLVAKEKKLQSLQASIDRMPPEEREELEPLLTPLYVELSEKKTELHAQKKWLEFGYPESCLSDYPDCVLFAFESSIIFRIEMFKNSRQKGPLLHSIPLTDAGEPQILIEGKHLPWSCIKDRLKKDREYSYISPYGIVEKSATPDVLYPIEQIDEDELQALRLVANAFWQNHPEVDPGIDKPCVLQIVTTGDDVLEPSWLTNGINYVSNKHASIRLVDAEGKVYSFGLEAAMRYQEYSTFHPYDFFVTGRAKVATPDYRDSRKFGIRRITNIPLTTARLESILQLAGEVNSDKGTRFHILKQNCNKFAVMALERAGIDLDTHTSPSELLASALPRLEDVPVLGWLFRKVCQVVKPIFSFLRAITPAPIKWAYGVITTILFYIPNKIRTVVFNCILIYFGARNEAEQADPGDPDNEAMNARAFIKFRALITWWGDIFDDEKAICNHSYKLTDWQENQATTRTITHGTRPTMHLLS